MTVRAPVIASLLWLAQAHVGHAWQAGAEGRICTLEHSGTDAEARLTFDPAGPLYTISVTRAEPWPDAAIFAIRFEGPRANTISTTRHMLSDDGLTLTVSDSGFGNVLNGLEFNALAIAVAGDTGVVLDLAGAAPEVAEFRACGTAPSA
jgi:hypothetical protein